MSIIKCMPCVGMEWIWICAVCDVNLLTDVLTLRWHSVTRTRGLMGRRSGHNLSHISLTTSSGLVSENKFQSNEWYLLFTPFFKLRGGFHRRYTEHFKVHEKQRSKVDRQLPITINTKMIFFSNALVWICCYYMKKQAPRGHGSDPNIL